jgi:aspartate/methionine/tyrosine aminotransferase
MAIVTERILNMQRSGIRAILNLANQMPGEIIHLEIGQPHFPTPAFIIEAVMKAIAGGHIRYTKNEGIPEVRAKIAQKLMQDFPALTLTEENVLLTTGGVYGLAIAIMALVNPGEKVLIPDPGWPNYTMQAITAHGVPQYYPLRLERGFKPFIDDLERVVTADTKVLIVNNPSNPMGTVLTESECKQILDFALAHHLTVLSDEVYDRIVFDGPCPSMASLRHPASLITINSFSKTYAMTGWRIGYLLAEEELCRQLVKLSESFISCPSFISQKGAEAAITGPQDFTASMVSYYRTNRDLTVSMLAQSGLHFAAPQGAFYALVDISPSRLDSESFAKKLLMEQRVAVAPGKTFGPSSDQFVRLSFCTTTETLEQGLHRLLQFVQTQPTGR